MYLPIISILNVLQTMYILEYLHPIYVYILLKICSKFIPSENHIYNLKIDKTLTSELIRSTHLISIVFIVISYLIYAYTYTPIRLNRYAITKNFQYNIQN